MNEKKNDDFFVYDENVGIERSSFFVKWLYFCSTIFWKCSERKIHRISYLFVVFIFWRHLNDFRKDILMRKKSKLMKWVWLFVCVWVFNHNLRVSICSPKIVVWRCVRVRIYHRFELVHCNLYLFVWLWVWLLCMNVLNKCDVKSVSDSDFLDIENHNPKMLLKSSKTYFTSFVYFCILFLISKTQFMIGMEVSFVFSGWKHEWHRWKSINCNGGMCGVYEMWFEWMIVYVCVWVVRNCDIASIFDSISLDWYQLNQFVRIHWSIRWKWKCKRYRK